MARALALLAAPWRKTASHRDLSSRSQREYQCLRQGFALQSPFCGVLRRIQIGLQCNGPDVGVSAEPAPTLQSLEILLRLLGSTGIVRGKRAIAAEVNRVLVQAQ